VAVASPVGTPHDTEAERRVLGALLIDRDAIFQVVDQLEPDDFFGPGNRRTYSAITGLLERQEQIDPLTVQLEMSRRGDLALVGGPAFLNELSQSVATAVDIARDARMIKQKSLLRSLLNAAINTASDAYEEPTDIPLTLDRAEQRIFTLRDRTKRAQLRHIRHSLVENYERLTHRMEHPAELTGLPSGFKEIDAFTEGFNRGELIVLAARPAVGKTSLALAIAHHVARANLRALVFTLEMDFKQIVARFLGLTGQTNLLTLRTGADVLDTQAAEQLRSLDVFIDDTPGLSVMELRTKARRVASAQPVNLIIVDYLQLMRTDEHEENRVQEISTITRNLKSLARELDTVVIALSQLSRAAGDAGSEPRLSTLRESGSIEQDADVVVMLWRDKEDPPLGAPRLIHGSIAKNRNGPTGPFVLYFEGERARFFSAADNEGVPI